MAAIITKVGGDATMTVFNPGGGMQPMTLPQGNPRDEGRWHWPERV